MDAPTPLDIRRLLEAVARGELEVDDAHERLDSRSAAIGRPFETLRIDRGRETRCGSPEIVYGAGKTDDEIVAACEDLFAANGRCLVSRVDEPRLDRLRARLSRLDAVVHPRARCLSMEREPRCRPGRIAVLGAGTSDAPVVEEAALAARFVGVHAEVAHDVGVAGLERLFSVESTWREADVVIVVAGMDGALPAVVGGLTHQPIIAVPTSVGYGAAFEGLGPLLNMMNACAPGVAVVNIDNGIGAGVMATRICAVAERRATGEVPR